MLSSGSKKLVTGSGTLTSGTPISDGVASKYSENRMGYRSSLGGLAKGPGVHTGPIECGRRLGGMLNYYYREAA
jgi:hypothetical protein